MDRVTASVPIAANRPYWFEARACEGLEATEALPYGASGECVAYTGCAAEVRYCLYGEAAGHQRPAYSAEASLTWFGTF